MRKYFILIVAVVSVGFLANSAMAEIVEIKGKVTPVALGRACSGAGGSFNSNPTGYSCEKKDCNGKGGTCGVYCSSNGNCTGTTPSRIKPGTTLTSKASDLVRTLNGSLDFPPAAPGAVKPPSAGILDSRPGLSPQGPARTGSPRGGTIY